MLFQHIAKFKEALIFLVHCIFLFIIMISLVEFTEQSFGFSVPHSLEFEATTSSSLIVRPAVSRVLAPLKGGLKHRDWAGLTEYTSPLGFALSYVFDKQSGSPCYCDLQMP